MDKETELLRVLIVEDNEEFCSFLKATVYQRYPRAAVVEAHDGAGGLRLHATFKPHLAFIDINLPGDINGLQLTKQLRAAGSPVRIVIITSHDLPEYRSAASRLGADTFLSKSSLSPPVIQSLMDQVLATGLPRSK
jgi:DNA-binding NarL/FixJ family response regulator